MASPRWYGVPHDSWREHQEETVNWVQDSKYRLMVMEAATGAGKSGICAAVGSHGKSVTALTLTLALQQQYHEQYDFAHLYGMSNYPCELDIMFRADTCRHMEDMYRCPVSDYCKYLIARANYQAAKRRTTNYHYFLSAPWMPQHQTTYLFCDEAHKLPEIVEKHMSLEMTVQDVIEADLPLFPDKSVKSNGVRLMLAHNWLGECMKKLEPRIDSLRQRAMINPKLLTKLRELEKWYNAISNCFYGIDTDRANWFVHYDSQHIKIIPLDVSMFFKPLFVDPFYHKLVLMSATIGSVRGFAQSLGINNYDFYSVPNRFTPDERPVWIFEDAPRMSYRAPHTAWDKQAEIIASVFKKGPKKPGIIHLNSIAKTEALARRLAKRGLEDRVFIPTGKGTTEKLNDLHKNIQKTPDGIALTWAMSEGVDLPDFFYNISADVPFWGLGSPDGRAKMEANPSYYRWVAATQLQQRTGRTRRGVPEHYDINGQRNGFVAIVDNNVSMLQDDLSDDFKFSLNSIPNVDTVL